MVARTLNDPSRIMLPESLGKGGMVQRPDRPVAFRRSGLWELRCRPETADNASCRRHRRLSMQKEQVSTSSFSCSVARQGFSPVQPPDAKYSWVGTPTIGNNGARRVGLPSQNTPDRPLKAEASIGLIRELRYDATCLSKQYAHCSGVKKETYQRLLDTTRS